MRGGIKYIGPKYFVNINHYMVAWLEFDPKADPTRVSTVLGNAEEVSVCP